MTARRYRAPTAHDLAVEAMPRIERRTRVLVAAALAAELELECRLLSEPDGRRVRWSMLEDAVRMAVAPDGWRVYGVERVGNVISAYDGHGGCLELALRGETLVLSGSWRDVGLNVPLSKHRFELTPAAAAGLAGRNS